MLEKLKVVEKIRVEEAVQLTVENYKEVCEWLELDAYDSVRVFVVQDTLHLEVRSGFGMFSIKEGQWLVKTDTGFKMYPSKFAMDTWYLSENKKGKIKV